MKASYEGIQGTLDIETNEVFFFNRRFNSILNAIEFFKAIKCLKKKKKIKQEL